MSLRAALRDHSRTLVRGGEDTRPRATWRVVVPVAAVLVFGIATTALLTLAASARLADDFLLALLGDVVLVLGVLGVLVGAARYLDRRDITDYGFGLSRGWWIDLAAGAVLGVSVVTAAFLLSRALGGIEVVATLSPGATDSFVAGLLLFAVSYLCTSVWEEALFRGLLVTNAAEGFAARGLPPGTALLGALAVSSVGFGALHAPLSQLPGGASLAGMLVVWTLMGGLLGLGYVLSGELAFPIGLHFTANLAIVNGYLGAGTPAPPSVFRTEVTATALWHPFGGVPFVATLVAGYAVAAGWFRLRYGGLSLAESIATPPTTASGSAGTDNPGDRVEGAR